MTSRASDLAERLSTLAIVSRDELARAREEGDRTGRSLAAALVDLGYIAADALALFICEQYHLPRVDLTGVSSDAVALAAVPLDVRMRLRVVPLRVRRPVLLIAVDDPSDTAVIDELKRITMLHPEAVVASVPDLDAALARMDLTA
jgi:hypothetical protein